MWNVLNLIASVLIFIFVLYHILELLLSQINKQGEILSCLE